MNPTEGGKKRNIRAEIEGIVKRGVAEGAKGRRIWGVKSGVSEMGRTTLNPVDVWKGVIIVIVDWAISSY